MLIVLDTNVIISALLSSRGAPAEIINRWEADDFEVATSLPLLDELERVLAYPRIRERFREPHRITEVLNRFRSVAIVVEPLSTVDIIEADPTDDRFLECAVAAGASVIVSGDEHLLAIKKYKEIVILTPAEFLAFVALEK